MTPSIRDYWQELLRRFGNAWNRFWFTPGDPLVLCALRMATGIVALYLLLTFSPDLRAFFAAGGLLPPGAVSAWALEHGSPGFWTVDKFSYLSYVGDPTALAVLHVAGMVVLLAFTVGLFTRVTSILSLVVVLSYMHRAPMLVSQAEPIVAMMMFYLCLAPCGACLSLDALWRRRVGMAGVPGAEPSEAGSISLDDSSAPPQPHTLSPWATLATRLLQIHVAALYLMIAMAQLAGGASSVWWEGGAVWMLASRPEMPLVSMTWLAGHPFLIDLCTRFIVGVELGFPLLVWHRPLRPFVLAAAAIMWGGLALLTGLTVYCLVIVIASLSFVPPQWPRAWWASAKASRMAAVVEVAPASDAVANEIPPQASSPPPREKSSRKSGKPHRQPARTKS
jgi:hypothetical protein